MDLKSRSRNAFWACVIAEEFARNDINRVCITPGSRNSPLTLAFDQQPSIQTYSHLDERPASFFGIGVSDHTGDPSIICSTSGTATTEYHPAVLEADESHRPLIILTADRPPELHQAGANQTTNQQNLYTDSVRWSHQLAEVELDSKKVRHLRLMLNRAIEESTGSPPGPVHLNVPFRKPLEPPDEPSPKVQDFMQEHQLAAEGRSDGSYVDLSTGPNTLSNESINTLLSQLREAKRPLIYLGPLSLNRQKTYKNIQQFSSSQPIPVMADPLSGQRFSRSDNSPLLVNYEHYLNRLIANPQLQPDLLLRFGSPPNASHNLMDFFEMTEARQVLIAEHHPWPDQSLRPAKRLQANPDHVINLLRRHLNKSSEPLKNFSDRLRSLDKTCDDILSDQLEDDTKQSRSQEIRLCRELFRSLDPEDVLFVGNSTPVRDFVDYSGLRNASYSLTANRGMSGIDGLISTSAGLASQTEGIVVSLIGDISFYHDLNGLLAFDRLNLPGYLIVINNQGGGIFHRLPIEDFDPPFSSLIKTDHEMTFKSIANQFNAEYHESKSVKSVIDGYRDARSQNKFVITEVKTDAEANQRFREELDETIGEELSKKPH